MSLGNFNKGLLMLIAASLIWSTTPVFSKLVYREGLHPIVLVELRLIIGFVVLLAAGHDPRSTRGSYKELVNLAVFGLAANYLVYHLSVYYTTASSAQVLEGTAPVFVLIIAALTHGEPINFKKVVGVSLTLVGAALIFYSHFDRTFVIGDILGVIAAMTWAYFIVKGSRTLMNLEPAESLVFLFGFSALILLPLALSHDLMLSSKAAVIVAVMGLLHTYAAYMLYFRGIKFTTPVTAGVVFALNPLLTVYLSNALLGETAGGLYYLGVGFTVAGVLLVILRSMY